MMNLLKADVIQLVTTRTARFSALIVFGLTIVGCLIVLIRMPQPIEIKNLQAFNPVLLFFAMITVTSGYRHRVAVTEQLISPKIWDVMLSKLIVLGGAGALFVLMQTGIIGIMFGLWPSAGLNVTASDLWPVGLSAFGGAISAMLGVALGRLIRVPVAAILGTVAYGLILEPALRSSLLVRLFGISEELYEKLMKFLPGPAFNDLVGDSAASSAKSAAILLAWVALISFCGLLLDRRREWR